MWTHFLFLNELSILCDASMHRTAFVLCSYFFSLFWHWVTNLILSVLHGPLGIDVQIISIIVPHPPSTHYMPLCITLFLMLWNLQRFLKVEEESGCLRVKTNLCLWSDHRRSISPPLLLCGQMASRYILMFCVLHQWVMTPAQVIRLIFTKLMISFWTPGATPSSWTNCLHLLCNASTTTTSFVLCSYPGFWPQSLTIPLPFDDDGVWIGWWGDENKGESLVVHV